MILHRASVNLSEERLEIRIGFGLPGNGRRIDGEILYPPTLQYNSKYN